jgi:hypothetical protein
LSSGGFYGEKSDVWALGQTIVKMLTPYESNTVNPCSPYLATVVSRMLSAKPKQRSDIFMVKAVNIISCVILCQFMSKQNSKLVFSGWVKFENYFYSRQTGIF